MKGKLRNRIASRRIATLLFALIGLIALMPVPSAMAVAPYGTGSLSADGYRFVSTPLAYVPGDVWWGFNSPQDLFVTAGDEIFVADTGNNRIVQLDRAGKVVRSIPDEEQAKADPDAKLNGPSGVFVTDGGEIYVADTNRRRIAVFGADGKYVKQFQAPDSTLLPEGYTFVPLKIVIDQRGYMFVATKVGSNGLLQLSEGGEFIGFFGANKVSLDWLTALKRQFSQSNSLRSGGSLEFPNSITNVTVDSRGFLYTANAGLERGQLRHLSFGGKDLLQDHNFASWLSSGQSLSFQDVYVNKDGVMTAIDSEFGQIHEFNKYGRQLFVFGQKQAGSQRLGMFDLPTAISGLSDGTLLVADAGTGVIQTLRPTDFGRLVLSANADYENGDYVESRAKWEQILKLDGLYNFANLAIAKADFELGDFRSAARNFKIANDREGYSDAFWQIRMNWLFRYFGLIATIVFGLLVLLWIGFAVRGARLRKRERERRSGASGAEEPAATRRGNIDPFTGLMTSHTGNRWLISLHRAGSMFTHPVSTMTDIVERGQVRFGFAALIVCAGFVSSIAGQAVVGYLFAYGSYEHIRYGHEALYYFLPWLLWVAANYLVGSVMKGEGSWKRVFIVNAYAMLPFVVLNVPIQWFSNALTLQEGILYSAMNRGMILWVGVLMVIATLKVHNYNAKETIRMLIVALFTYGCLWVFGMVLVALIQITIDFFAQWGRELRGRV